MSSVIARSFLNLGSLSASGILRGVDGTVLNDQIRGCFARCCGNCKGGARFKRRPLVVRNNVLVHTNMILSLYMGK